MVLFYFSYMGANNIAFPSKSTYFENQRSLHLPVIQKTWEFKRGEAVAQSKERGHVNLAGDGR